MVAVWQLTLEFQNFFYYFATMELVLQSSRFVIEKVRTSYFVGECASLLHIFELEPGGSTITLVTAQENKG